MTIEDIAWNILLMLLCYVYVLFVIFVSTGHFGILPASRKASRKFLHMMIGNLLFVIPFFTLPIFPVLVAAPFILVTCLASPYAPIKGISRKLKGLSGISEEGHSLGLVFYAVSYTFLAWLFASKPYVIAAGILPMAYGDAMASLVGERYGRRRYKLAATKSLEGSAAMFLTSFLSLLLGLFFFSPFYGFAVSAKLIPTLAAAMIAALAEGFSPMGFDNLTVPAFSVLTFLLLGGGS